MGLANIGFPGETASPSVTYRKAHESMDAIGSLPILETAVGLLTTGFFLRGTGTDSAHVQMLAEVASFNELPPILVQRGNWRIIDGMHRSEAAKLRGEKTIRARVIDCTDDDAFILAVKMNTQHGLPLSRSDRTVGAKRILMGHPDWSDRAIGVATGLSAKTIAGIRRNAAGEVPQLGKRLGRDGKRRPVAAAEGRKRAADYIAVRPDASLREVARETDVSLGTVQDVRARIRRGLDPLTAGQSRPTLRAADSMAVDGACAGSSAPKAGPRRETPVRGDAHGRPRADQPMTTPVISLKLASDPRLKYTEDGRAFVRWMAMHVIGVEQWREFVNVAPAHWTMEIALMAERASDEWRDFARQLKNRREEAV
jgi:ParB-like chromosome segregation protein Spo0J